MFKGNESAKSSLGVGGRAPDDQEKFLTVATVSYASALAHSTYLTALIRRGYNQAAVQAEQAKLKALTEADAAHQVAKAAAKRATADRDSAAKALDAWWAEFRAVAQVALKERPDLLAQLES